MTSTMKSVTATRSALKTYSVLFAEDVPHYGFAEIEAEDDVAALEAAKAYDLSEVTVDPEWENTVSKRIVHIEDPAGNNDQAYDVPLDDYSLRFRRREVIVGCAMLPPEMLKALELCEECAVRVGYAAFR